MVSPLFCNIMDVKNGDAFFIIGSGIKRMRDLMLENNLPEPIFDNKKFFNITFVRDNKNIRDDVRNNYIRQLAEKQRFPLNSNRVCRINVSPLIEDSRCHLSW